jgi:hypothetical protein
LSCITGLRVFGALLGYLVVNVLDVGSPWKYPWIMDLGSGDNGLRFRGQEKAKFTRFSPLLGKQL